ncbi:hypothetical protein niasHS_006090 [Heterodera schachtii]|uniref:Uncharacterized protein n=1 Tax=Heterodera schachtii TaxID=97005 RepID=A0ABD2JW83_HETSC
MSQTPSHRQPSVDEQNLEQAVETEPHNSTGTDMGERVDSGNVTEPQGNTGTDTGERIDKGNVTEPHTSTDTGERVDKGNVTEPHNSTGTVTGERVDKGNVTEPHNSTGTDTGERVERVEHFSMSALLESMNSNMVAVRTILEAMRKTLDAVLQHLMMQNWRPPMSINSSVPDNSPETVPDNSPETVPDNSPETVPDNSPETVPDNSSETVPDNSPEPVPDNSLVPVNASVLNHPPAPHNRGIISAAVAILFVVGFIHQVRRAMRTRRLSLLLNVVYLLLFWN